MKKVEKEELKKILENHKHWLSMDCADWEHMKAHLRFVDLSGANLCYADLRDADLYGANLSGANLCYADLRDADLYGANLSGAILRCADLSCANLSGVNFYGADLYETTLRRANLQEASLYAANLCGANLIGAYLFGVNLSHATLSGASLYGACLNKGNLSEANLSGVNFYGADLCGVKNIPFIPYACPDFGSFVGFKKANKHIVVLEIPEDAKRLSAAGRKCRCDKAKVLRIENLDGTESGLSEVPSSFDKEFIYRIGEVVSVKDFDENRWNECSAGIHFFINRQEAVDYR